MPETHDRSQGGKKELYNMESLLMTGHSTSGIVPLSIFAKINISKKHILNDMFTFFRGTHMCHVQCILPPILTYFDTNICHKNGRILT